MILSWSLNSSPWYCDAEDLTRPYSRCGRVDLCLGQEGPKDVPLWLGENHQATLTATANRVAATSSQGPEVLRQHMREEAIVASACAITRRHSQLLFDLPIAGQW